MTGDYTKVPLRPHERWTGARMQEGRVLLDHEWNLNLDAPARATRAAVADTIGPAGVVEGSDAFKVNVTPAGALDVTLEPGRIWVDGLMTLAPAAFTYSSQDQIEALPGAGRALVYLDVWEEHVQPAESPELVDPALAPVDSAARTRVGYRVRIEPTSAETCTAAWEALDVPAGSSGRLTITRTGAPAPADPCDPPGDPLGRVPDGLFRVEVLDGGDQGSARFAWSFENGGAAVGVAERAGNEITLLPSQAVKFADGELVEVSWIARRADRLDHGALYSVESVAQGAGGDVLTLDRAPTAPDGADGLAVRRWDGEVEGAGTDREAALRGVDIGIRFSAAAGNYQVGDWWGARLREGDGAGIEERADAEPDGARHAFAPLALVDLGARAVLDDCRPTFHPLVGLGLGGGSCTVTARPGDDLQAKLDSLPEEGGELCLAAGTYELATPLAASERTRVVITGAGPATVLRAVGNEAAVVVDGCSEIEVRHVRVEGDSPGAPPGNRHLNGALTVVASSDVYVSDCVLACPESTGLAQTCLTVRSGEGQAPDRVRVERNRLEVGTWQTGVLLVDAGRALVAANHLLAAEPEAAIAQGIVFAGQRQAGAAQVINNVVEGAVQGIHVGVSDPLRAGREALDEVAIDGNAVHCRVPAAYDRDRNAILVGNARSIEVAGNRATVERSGPVPAGGPTPIEGVRLHGVFGPYLNVRATSLQGFSVGVRVRPLTIPRQRLWVVSETMAFGAGTALDAPEVVQRERNVP